MQQYDAEIGRVFLDGRLSSPSFELVEEVEGIEGRLRRKRMSRYALDFAICTISIPWECPYVDDMQACPDSLHQDTRFNDRSADHSHREAFQA